MSAVKECKSINESVKNNPLIGKFYNALMSSDVIGVKPSKMPTPNTNPVSVLFDHAAILALIEVADLTFLEIEKRSRYGVYYTVLALFNGNMWLSRDQSGLYCLRVYNVNFN